VENRTASPRTTPPTSPPATSKPADSAPGSEAAATTTTAPKRPTADDVELLAFAQSFELTARDLYQAALDADLANSDLADVFHTLRDNHGEYANRLSGILGVDAAHGRNDELYDQLVSGFESNDPAAVATAGEDLESTAVATHNELIGRLAALDGIAAIASIAVVEARQGTVLADIAGNGDDLDAMLTADAEALELPAGAES
jgi:Ferritin-like domain